MSGLTELVRLSRRFGADPEWLLAGGGNTSFKEGPTLHVKASGSSLATIDETGFCSIDRSRLELIWAAVYPAQAEAREAAALADLMAARSAGETKRPSVETLMHGLFPQAYVVHTHPALVNGLTCGREGRAAFDRLFAEEAIWVPFVDPGYVLAKTVRDALETYRAEKGRLPALMFMQNHGLLVAHDSPAGILELSELVMQRLRAETRRLPDLGSRSVDAALLARAAATLQKLAGGPVFLRHRADAEILARAASRESFDSLARPFSPDHIVYAGHEFLHVESLGEDGAARALETAWAEYRTRNGGAPRIVLIGGLGAFACAPSKAGAETAMELFVDACKIAAYAENFGGPSPLSQEKIDFIRNWEVERYRSQVAAGR